MDGNFAAEHQRMRNREDDVRLSDGQAFFVTADEYATHLKTAQNKPEVRNLTMVYSRELMHSKRSTCNNHKAVNASNAIRRSLESTGIGATACARHGCFVPHSVVDFQKGER